jgi:hypothetical protein
MAMCQCRCGPPHLSRIVEGLHHVPWSALGSCPKPHRTCHGAATLIDVGETPLPCLRPPGSKPHVGVQGDHPRTGGVLDASKEGGLFTSVWFSLTSDFAQSQDLWSKGVRLRHTNRVVVAPIVDHPDTDGQWAQGCLQIVQQRANALAFVPHGYHHFKDRCLPILLPARVSLEQGGLKPPVAPAQQGERVAQKGGKNKDQERVREVIHWERF